MLNTLNKPWITLLTLAGFIALACYSEPYGHGYTQEERQGMNRLIESLAAPRTNAEKMVYLYGE